MTETRQLHHFTDRLTRLERENRLWRLVGVAALVTSGFMFLVAAASPTEEIRAKRLVIMDDQGHERGWLKIDASDTVSFGIANRDGKAAISAVVVPSGPMSFSLRDRNNKLRVVMGIDTSDGAAIGLLNETQRHRVGIAAGHGIAGVRLNGKNENVLAEFKVTPDERIGLGFYGKDGKLIWKAP